MTAYILRRLVLLVPTALGVVTVVFILMRIVPGDPVRLMVGFDVDQATVDEMRRNLGLDRPIVVQYIDYLGMIVTGDLGESLRSRRPVIDEVTRHFRNTLILALVSIVIAVVVGVLLGIVAAYRRSTLLDNITMVGAVLGISTPSFYLGILLILLFAVTLQWLPAGGAGTPAHIILPALTLAAGSTSIIARMTRSSLLEVLGRDYMRTAVAKGLGPRAVLLLHGLRNALIPTVTVIGLEFGFILGGSVLVETVFSYPGIGQLMISAISTRDFPLVQGAVIFVAIMFIVVNLLTDIIYAILDPRITY